MRPARIMLASIAALAIVTFPGASLASAAELELRGAGATFPAAIYAKWFEEYHKAHADVRVAYDAVGSGGGIRALLDAKVDFAASDGPMTDEQLATGKVKILHFPTVLGAVVPIANVPGLTKALRYTPEILAGIFLGKITRWSAAEIAAANPGVKLPDDDILVVHRSDGSGTTYVWTDYLSKVSPGWKDKVGRGISVRWPVGLAAKGNDGVASLVKQTSGSIGYVELTYATANGLDYGAVKNGSGAFVKATLPAVTAAAGAHAQVADDFRMSIVDAAGKDAYPISSFTWLLVPASGDDAAKRKALADLLRWMIADGQRLASALAYAPLPKSIVERETKAIAALDGDTAHP